MRVVMLTAINPSVPGLSDSGCAGSSLLQATKASDDSNNRPIFFIVFNYNVSLFLLFNLPIHNFATNINLDLFGVLVERYGDGVAHTRLQRDLSFHQIAHIVNNNLYQGTA